MRIVMFLLFFGLVGCSAPGQVGFHVTEYGEFCGQGRPDVGPGTVEQQLQRMARIRPRDTLDARCRDHDVCVMKEGLLSPLCSRAMRDGVITVANNNKMTPRCVAMADNLLNFFAIQDEVRGRNPTNAVGALEEEIRRVGQVPLDVVSQVLNGGVATVRAPFRAMTGWPDQFEPCFSLVAGASGQDWPIPMAQQLGRSIARPEPHWVQRQLLPRTRLIHHPEWREEKDGGTNTLVLLRHVSGAKVTAKFRVVSAQRPVSPQALAAGLADSYRQRFQGTGLNAVLLDVAPGHSLPTVRYLLDGGGQDHRLAYATSFNDSGQARVLLIEAEVPPTAGSRGISIADELARSIYY